MNQRQIERTKLLIDVIANKIKLGQPIAVANYCMSRHICGTAGCVWGDFVIARRGISTASLDKLNRSLTLGKDTAQTFGEFSKFVTSPTLKRLTRLLNGYYPLNDDRHAMKEYFGVSFNLSTVFGVAHQASWRDRYKTVVLSLWNEGPEYDPLGLYNFD